MSEKMNDLLMFLCGTMFGLMIGISLTSIKPEEIGGYIVRKNYCDVCGCIMDPKYESDICEVCLDELYESDPGEEVDKWIY